MQMPEENIAFDMSQFACYDSQPLLYINSLSYNRGAYQKAKLNLVQFASMEVGFELYFPCTH